MKSKQISYDIVGKRKVDTSLITIAKPGGGEVEYYETAIYEPKDKRWDVQSSGIIKREHADECHAKAVRLAGIREGLNG